MSDPTPDPTMRPASRRRWLRLALLVSLAANLLVVGAIAGALILRGPDRASRTMVIDLSFAPYTRAMSVEQRAALRAAWHADRSDEPLRLRETQRRELAELIAALRADAPQMNRIESILDRQHHRRTEHARRAAQVLAAHIARMPPVERRAFAERLETLGDSRPPHRSVAPR